MAKLLLSSTMKLLWDSELGQLFEGVGDPKILTLENTIWRFGAVSQIFTNPYGTELWGSPTAGQTGNVINISGQCLDATPPYTFSGICISSSQDLSTRKWTYYLQVQVSTPDFTGSYSLFQYKSSSTTYTPRNFEKMTPVASASLGDDLKITGGSAVTQSDLIDWFIANADGPIPEYTITPDISGLDASSNPTVIRPNRSVTLEYSLESSADYVLPNKILSITGADGSYSKNEEEETCSVTLSNPTANVKFKLSALHKWAITVNNKAPSIITPASTNPTYIIEESTAVLKFSLAERYKMGQTEVQGCSVQWSSDRTQVTLSNPTGPVTVTVNYAWNQATIVIDFTSTSTETSPTVFVFNAGQTSVTTKLTLKEDLRKYPLADKAIWVDTTVLPEGVSCTSGKYDPFTGTATITVENPQLKTKTDDITGRFSISGDYEIISCDLWFYPVKNSTLSTASKQHFTNYYVSVSRSTMPKTYVLLDKESISVTSPTICACSGSRSKSSSIEAGTITYEYNADLDQYCLIIAGSTAGEYTNTLYVKAAIVESGTSIAHIVVPGLNFPAVVRTYTAIIPTSGTSTIASNIEMPVGKGGLDFTVNSYKPSDNQINITQTSVVIIGEPSYLKLDATRVTGSALDFCDLTASYSTSLYILLFSPDPDPDLYWTLDASTYVVHPADIISVPFILKDSYWSWPISDTPITLYADHLNDLVDTYTVEYDPFTHTASVKITLKDSFSVESGVYKIWYSSSIYDPDNYRDTRQECHIFTYDFNSGGVFTLVSPTSSTDTYYVINESEQNYACTYFKIFPKHPDLPEKTAGLTYSMGDLQSYLENFCNIDFLTKDGYNYYYLKLQKLQNNTGISDPSKSTLHINTCIAPVNSSGKRDISAAKVTFPDDTDDSVWACSFTTSTSATSPALPLPSNKYFTYSMNSKSPEYDYDAARITDEYSPHPTDPTKQLVTFTVRAPSTTDDLKWVGDIKASYVQAPKLTLTCAESVEGSKEIYLIPGTDYSVTFTLKEEYRTFPILYTYPLNTKNLKDASFILESSCTCTQYDPFSHTGTITFTTTGSLPTEDNELSSNFRLRTDSSATIGCNLRYIPVSEDTAIEPVVTSCTVCKLSDINHASYRTYIDASTTVRIPDNPEFVYCIDGVTAGLDPTDPYNTCKIFHDYNTDSTKHVFCLYDAETKNSTSEVYPHIDIKASLVPYGTTIAFVATAYNPSYSPNVALIPTKSSGESATIVRTATGIPADLRRASYTPSSAAAKYTMTVDKSHKTAYITFTNTENKPKYICSVYLTED